MPTKRKDANKTAAKQVAKVTKTALPSGESLLGSSELKRQFTEAKVRADQNGKSKR